MFSDIIKTTIRYRSVEQQIILMTSLALGTVFVLMYNFTGNTLPELLFIGLLFIALFSLVLAIPVAYGYLPNGPRMLRAGLIAALVSILLGAALYTTCTFNVTSECYEPQNAAQAWEKLGRYGFFAIPVCVAITLIATAIHARRLTNPPSLEVVGFTILFALVFAGTMLSISGVIQENHLAVRGPEFNEIDIIWHALLPIVVFIAIFYYLYLKLSNEWLMEKLPSICLAFCSAVIVFFAALSYFLWGMDKNFFFRNGDATGIGQGFTAFLLVVSLIYLINYLFMPKRLE